MKEIQLSQGYVAQVDDADYPMLMDGPKWHARIDRYKGGGIRNVYAIRSIRLDGKRITQMMHRFLLDVTDPKVQIDHKNHAGRDNRRENLRIASSTENNRNCRMSTRNTSGKKGVTWHKNTKKWRAYIRIDGRNTHLGLFTSKVEAARIYDAAAIAHHGLFAFTNAAIEAA
jgi:hypothetical protein